MAKFEYSIRSRDETGAGVKSAQNNLKGLEGSMRGISQTMKLLMGGGAIAGVTMALRRMYSEAAACEKAFADLHPETQKVAGSMMQFQKAVNESKASFGGLINEIVSPARSILIASIQDATDKMKEMNGEADSVGETIGRVGVYTVKVFQTLGRLIYDNQNLFAISIKAIWEVVKSVGEFIWLPLKKGFLLIIQPIKQAFMDMVNWILAQVTTMVNWIGTALGKVSGGKLGAGLAGFNAGQLTMQDLNPDSVQLKSINKLFDEIGDTFGDVGEELKKIAGAYVDIWTRKPGDARLYGITGNPGTAAGSVYDPSGENLTGNVNYSVGGESAISKLMGFLEPIISQFQSLSMILNPVTTIMQAMWQALEPVVNQLLAPLVGILTIIGQLFAAVITPALQIFGPIIQFISDIFVWLYNHAIMPLANGFITMFNALRALGQLIFYITTFQWGKIKNISWDVTTGHLQAIDTNTLHNAGEQAIGETSGGTTSTYSAGRDIVVNVVINSQVITGDGGFRELALMLNREIQNAMALGVA